MRGPTPSDKSRDELVAGEVGRLEGLWRGDFGDAYTARNRAAGDGRGPFWQGLVARSQPRRVLEVGCNLGANIRWLVPALPPRAACGIDVNLGALVELRRAGLDVSLTCTQARALPFRDGEFDLVFTMGVLIHQPPDALPTVMAEIVRCSCRFVLCGEYFAPEATEVAYRGEKCALFKRDFGGLYCELFPALVVREQGFLSRRDGWDDITYWLLEKSA